MNLVICPWFSKLIPPKLVLIINNFLGDLLICQTFFTKCSKRVNLPNFSHQTFQLYSIIFTMQAVYCAYCLNNYIKYLSYNYTSFNNKETSFNICSTYICIYRNIKMNTIYNCSYRLSMYVANYKNITQYHYTNIIILHKIESEFKNMHVLVVSFVCSLSL